MPNQQNKAGGDIFIVDNTDEYWKVAQYLQEWTQIARSFDIATGYLCSLSRWSWQKGLTPWTV